MSKEHADLDKARELVSEVVDQEKGPTNVISADTGSLDPRFALWRSFCREHGVSVDAMPGDLAEPLKVQWERFKEKEIHGPEEGRT